jgi:hypothetical protein
MLAAEVLKIIRRRKSPIRGVSEKCSRTLHILSGDSIHVFYQPLP